MRTRDRYKLYLKSPEWFAIRELALEYADHRCQVCNTVKKLNVHHRVYPKVLGEEKQNDLTVLCDTCHYGFHHNFTLKNTMSKAKKPKPSKKSLRRKKNREKKKANFGMTKEEAKIEKRFEPKHILLKGGK